ncbi:MAG: hypothetical protein AAF713_03890 [Pseudomonadota bacterium]
MKTEPSVGTLRLLVKVAAVDMAPEVMAAIIVSAGAIIAAIIGAYAATHKREDRYESRRFALEEATRVGSIQAVSAANEQGVRFRVPTTRLILRLTLCLILAGLVWAGAVALQPRDGTPEFMAVMAGLILFGGTAAIILLRLIYRLFWVIFVS